MLGCCGKCLAKIVLNGHDGALICHVSAVGSWHQKCWRPSLQGHVHSLCWRARSCEWAGAWSNLFVEHKSTVKELMCGRDARCSLTRRAHQWRVNAELGQCQQFQCFWWKSSPSSRCFVFYACPSQRTLFLISMASSLVVPGARWLFEFNSYPLDVVFHQQVSKHVS